MDRLGWIGRGIEEIEEIEEIGEIGEIEDIEEIGNWELGIGNWELGIEGELLCLISFWKMSLN